MTLVLIPPINLALLDHIVYSCGKVMKKSHFRASQKRTGSLLSLSLFKVSSSCHLREFSFNCHPHSFGVSSFGINSNLYSDSCKFASWQFQCKKNALNANELISLKVFDIFRRISVSVYCRICFQYIYSQWWCFIRPHNWWTLDSDWSGGV